jgi:hypothetical protein
MPQRSLVASHPLLSDAAVTTPRARIAHPMPPRCRSAHANVFELTIAGIARGLGLSEPAMVEGAWPHCRGASYPQTQWRHTGHRRRHGDGSPIHADDTDDPIHWRASAACLASPLRTVLDLLAGEFGPLTVNSTCRSPSHNRRVGGATRSYHLTGNAVDFRVRDDFREVHAFLKKKRVVGGLAHYGSGVFHIDTGPRRSWAPGSWRGARVRMARRAARRG